MRAQGRIEQTVPHIAPGMTTGPTLQWHGAQTIVEGLDARISPVGGKSLDQAGQCSVHGTRGELFVVLQKAEAIPDCCLHFV